MRRIDKGNEPVEWRQYRLTPGARFDGDAGARKALRRHLIAAQGYICAYCEGRIALREEEDFAHDTCATRLEHLVSQSIINGDPKGRQKQNESDKWWFEERERFLKETPQMTELDFDNIFLCCHGNTDGEKHCDNSKGDRCLHFSPCDPHFIEELVYKSDGTISHRVFEEELTDILKLNHSRLKKNRLEVMNVVSRELGKGQWPCAKIEKILAKLESRDPEGKYQPFSGMARYFLRKRLGLPGG